MTKSVRRIGATVMAAGVTGALFAAHGTVSAPRTVLSGSSSAGSDFTIAGSATGLFPGIPGDLVLTVHNPKNVTIFVNTLDVAKGPAGGACSPSYLTVANFSGSLSVPANGTSTKSLPIELLPTAPNVCKDYVFALSYTGTATFKAGSATTLASSANPSAFNQPVTVTARVAATASSSLAPTGSVTFYDGTGKLGTANLNASSQATLTTSKLKPGTHSITAVYAGDSDFSGSTSSAITQQVGPR